MEKVQNPASLSTEEEHAIHVMQLLGDKTRYKIFKLLMSGKEMCVSEIASELNISVSAVSQHFRNFEMIGLVDKERMGQRICYALRSDDSMVQKLATITKQ
jgi:DNA-binding transcriptional ArsR family regulator